jgi:hypothetical protein
MNCTNGSTDLFSHNQGSVECDSKVDDADWDFSKEYNNYTRRLIATPPASGAREMGA